MQLPGIFKQLFGTTMAEYSVDVGKEQTKVKNCVLLFEIWVGHDLNSIMALNGILAISIITDHR